MNKKLNLLVINFMLLCFTFTISNAATLNYYRFNRKNNTKCAPSHEFIAEISTSGPGQSCPSGWKTTEYGTSIHAYEGHLINSSWQSFGYFKVSGSFTPKNGDFHPIASVIESIGAAKEHYQSNNVTSQGTGAMPGVNDINANKVKTVKIVNYSVEVDAAGPNCSLDSSYKGCLKYGQVVTLDWKLEDNGCAGFDSAGTKSTTVQTNWTAGIDPDKVYYVPYDRFGNNYYINAVSKCSGTVKYDIDTTGPTFSVWYDPSDRWSQSKTVYAYNVKNTGCSGNGSCTSVTATRNGNYQVCCFDGAGNKSCNTITVGKIDRTPPSCGNTSFPGMPSGAYLKEGSQMKVNVPCSDAHAGCVKSNYEQTVTNAGEVKIYDNASNMETCNVSYRKDNSKPTIRITTDHPNNSANQYTKDTVRVTLTADDTGGAGVNRVCFKVAGKDAGYNKAEECVNGNTHTFDIPKEKYGVSEITAWAYDNAYELVNGTYTNNNGNRSTDAKKEVFIDSVNPIIESVKTIT